MRVLLIKTSSMGDVIHTLPALTDARKHVPEITFDWVVEKGFADIPTWHPAVNTVIPVALRRWRKRLWSLQTYREWRQYHTRLRQENYDLVLDAQGLIKSAFLTYFAKGLRCGLDWSSAREHLASLAYQRKYKVNFYQHAIHRARSLFALALGYPLPETLPAYGLKRQQFQAANPAQNKYVVFLHGTTWETKLWPESYWQTLARWVTDAGYTVIMSGGNEKELERSARIANGIAAVSVLPRLNIPGMAELLAQAAGVVAVDTGFAHLAAAFNVPTVSLYGPTNPQFTGTIGEAQSHVAAAFPCAPCLSKICTYQEKKAVFPACYTTVTPELVWSQLQALLAFR